MAKKLNKKTLREMSTDVSRLPLVFPSKQITWGFIGKEREHRVHIGDIVHFDWGGKNWGIVSEMFWNWGGEVLVIRNHSGFRGEWIAGKTEFRFPAEQCWFES